MHHCTDERAYGFRIGQVSGRCPVDEEKSLTAQSTGRCLGDEGRGRVSFFDVSCAFDEMFFQSGCHARNDERAHSLVGDVAHGDLDGPVGQLCLTDGGRVGVAVVQHGERFRFRFQFDLAEAVVFARELSDFLDARLGRTVVRLADGDRSFLQGGEERLQPRLSIIGAKSWPGEFPSDEIKSDSIFVELCLDFCHLKRGDLVQTSDLKRTWELDGYHQMRRLLRWSIAE